MVDSTSSSDQSANPSSIQQALLELLHIFTQVCEDNGLRYYAWGGTALGAVRHRGFIPWDDDIDVAMPREDYEKLCGGEIELPSGYRAFESTELLFGVFEDRMQPIEHGNVAWDERQPFLSIDIFPLDGVPKSPLIRKIHTLWCRMLFVAIKLKRLRYIQSVEGMKNRENTRPKREQLLIQYGTVITALLKPIDEMTLVRKYFQAVQRWSFDQSETVAYYSSRYRDKSFFPKSLIGRGIRMAFEDIEITVFESVDEYLRLLFGDSYMTPPPPEKQERHGTIRLVSHTVD